MKNSWAGEILAIEKSRKVKLDIVNRAMVWAQILEGLELEFEISLKNNKIHFVIKKNKKTLEIRFDSAWECSWRQNKVYNTICLNRHKLLPLLESFIGEKNE